MDYLARESSPFENGFWKDIDKTVIETASRTLNRFSVRADESFATSKWRA